MELHERTEDGVKEIVNQNKQEVVVGVVRMMVVRM